MLFIVNKSKILVDIDNIVNNLIERFLSLSHPFSFTFRLGFLFVMIFRIKFCKHLNYIFVYKF